MRPTDYPKPGTVTYYVKWRTRSKNKPHRTPYYKTLDEAEAVYHSADKNGYAAELVERTKVNIGYQDRQMKLNDRMMVILKLERRDRLLRDRENYLETLGKIEKELAELGFPVKQGVGR